jgi:hypothetical protein
MEGTMKTLAGFAILTAAAVTGLASKSIVPLSLLARADEVIE